MKNFLALRRVYQGFASHILFLRKNQVNLQNHKMLIYSQKLDYMLVAKKFTKKSIGIIYELISFRNNFVRLIIT